MAIKKCISIAMILILKLHTWGLAAQSLLPQVTNDPIALDTSVRYGTLDNGFTYYIKKTQDPKKEVYMKLAVKAGSFFETRSQEGYAHLLEPDGEACGRIFQSHQESRKYQHDRIPGCL